MSVTTITGYSIIYSSNSFRPRIGLMAGDDHVGQVVFHPDGQALPEDTILEGQAQLHMHLQDFANVIDLLRNERPIDLIFNGSGGGNENALRAWSEPVGEGERRR